MISLLLIKILTCPVRFLSYKQIHKLGKVIGSVLYYLIPHFRKRALSNLALALKLPNHEIRKLAKKTFQNLAITCLEYPRLAREDNIHNLVTCKNPEVAQALSDSGQSIVFFVGHQANWELLFFEATPRMPGVAIGRPIKNKRLYSWITYIREKFGGKMIAPKNAIKESLRALKQGKFIGIVGDQGMPDSGYAFPFFGLRAWTTPTPAILAHRTNSPLITATIERLDGSYEITYSDPIWPNPDAPLEDEINRLMPACLNILEKSIKKNPDQWLWQHNRWKQETPKNVYYRFRKETVLIILDDERYLDHLVTFRDIYPKAFLTVLAPTHLASRITLENANIIAYRHPKDCLLADYSYKLVFDFTTNPKIRRHYRKYGATDVLTLEALQKLSHTHQPTDLSTTLKKAICRAP